ncbi:MAG TPA: ketoacyl-ACP synthase III [Chitinophaga sp.]|uniref:3-oxoacyl-ACP synthase III family protein n=1 Tax=Chitinophaga sp. TaxID=1869181 RepID=UPI002DB70AEF|nr:ketoacyl-ACP synthase III [Chitinophaga sp.]HEU4554021.1 ketoacyl-ACP synthase III [Chitinophaga sp.]
MISKYQSVITGTGSYIPPCIQSNNEFANNIFYSEDKQPIPTPSPEIVDKFRKITGIEERRYTTDDLNASDIGSMAARIAIADSGVNPEEIDQIIVAHNFGDVAKNTVQSEMTPSLASRIKHKLGITNPACIAYDLIFGCPGWLQGLIQADAFFKAGIARKALVIGTEVLSRVIDVYDRDSMIFSDGAGAAILEYREAPDGAGMLGSLSVTHAMEEIDYINTGSAYLPEKDPAVQYLKMKGRKVYEYALKHVPAAMRQCLEKCGIPVQSLKKVFIHQANEKMDEAIVKRMFELYDVPLPENIMPMSIHWLGNSSVATIPTLYDLVRKEQVGGHQLSPGDVILFASVGAGMNINAVCYRY